MGINKALVLAGLILIQLPHHIFAKKSSQYFPSHKNQSYHQCKFSIKVIDIVETSFMYTDFSSLTNFPSCLDVCCRKPLCDGVINNTNGCFLKYTVSHPREDLLRPKNILNKYKRSVVPTQHDVSEKVTEKPENVTSASLLSTTPAHESYGRECEIGLTTCGQNERCNPLNSRRRSGTCVCVEGTKYDAEHGCVNIQTSTEATPLALPLEETAEATISQMVNITNLVSSSPSHVMSSTPTTTEVITKTTPVPLEEIHVQIQNESLVLDTGTNIYQRWFNLSATVDAVSAEKFVYKWTLVAKPSTDDSGSMKNGNQQTVSLTNLVPGVYKLQVVVTGPNAYGEAVGNITVHPASHRNKAPIAIIVPKNLTVNLPNNGVILDGSGSEDEEAIKSFHWELTMGPMSYKLQDETSKTLQLNNLIAGNYTIMLIVEDEQGLTGNTTASVSVVKETDYPPVANAGGDKIFYLPLLEDKVVLNGNMSSDDHGIKEWEWTKGPEDSGNAVDMQDTRTPQLQLSHLESGHYHLILKVTDASGQWSTSSAHVYVHDLADNIPKANAGANTTLVIPNTSTILDGSKSTGVTAQSHYLWKQLRGVTQGVLASPSSPQTNVSSLTKGSYVFSLTMWNGNDTLKNSTSNVTVNVIQDKNASPVARAGQDFEVILPTSAIVLNGSKSSDDISIVKWAWTRDAKSLAAGNVVKGSDRSPVLILTEAVPGLYIWNLTVWDDQGSTNSDTVSVIVKNGPNHLHEVEIVIGLDIQSFTVGQKNNLLQKLQLLVHSSSSDIKFLVQDVRGIPLSGRMSLVLIGLVGETTIQGYKLANELRMSVMNPTDTKILDVPIISIDTVVCQNNCSGHGECVQSSRECLCHSWWMESWTRRHLADGVPNCDWSVIYVFVTTVAVALLIGLAVWGSVLLVVRRLRVVKPKRPRHTRYSLLDNQDDTIKLRARPPRNLLDSSSSDSDSDALFDARKNRTRDKRSNGHVKLQRVRNT